MVSSTAVAHVVFTLLTIVSALIGDVRADPVEVVGDTVVIDATRIRRLRFGNCAFTSAAIDLSLDGVFLCVPDGTQVQLGPVVVTVQDAQTTTVTETSTGRVLWRTLLGGKTLIGTDIPVDAALYPDSSVTVVGSAIDRAVGPWSVVAETRFVAPVAGGTATLQQVRLAGNGGIRGTRLASDDDGGGVTVLSTGQVVVGDDVSAAFVAESIGSGYTVITRQATLAAAEAPVTSALPLVAMPVVNVRDRLYVTYYATGCAVFRWRDTATYELANNNCTEKGDWPGMSALVGSGYASAKFDCVTATWTRYTSAGCTPDDTTKVTATLPLGNCTADDTMRMVCASAT